MIPRRLPDMNDPAPTGTGPAGATRRRFLTGVAAGGAALAVASPLLPGPDLVPVAGAQEGGEEPELTADEMLVAQLASLALAAADGYGNATDPATSPLTEPVLEVVRVFGSHYNEQAAALNELLEAVVENPNGVLQAELVQAISGADDQAALLGLLRQLEDSMAATYFAALGALEDQNDAKTVATLLPVAGQHAVVLGRLAGAPLAELVPAEQTADGAYSETEYPTEGPAGTSDGTTSNGPLGSPGGAGPEVGEPNSVDGGEG